MFTCRLCHWEVTLDDVALKFCSGMVICVTCFARETQTERRMPSEVRRGAEAAAKDAERSP